jgi:natural product precursor
MKTKKFNKILVLNKETVSNLNDNEMKSVNGGGIMSAITGCTSCMSISCLFICESIPVCTIQNCTNTCMCTLTLDNCNCG